MNHTQTSKEKVVIIVPTYNEAMVIEETIAQLFVVATTLTAFDIAILIFDSASTDGTAAKVRALQHIYPKLYVQTEPQKTGLGSAYLQAMRYALNHMQADIVLEFDADLSHQPKFIPAMLSCLNSAQVVIGSRYVRGGSIPKNWGIHRKLLSYVGNLIARLILTHRYKDFTSGFRATRAAMLNQALPKAFLSNGYAYKLHLLWLLHQHHAVIREVPIDFIDREKGSSKLPKNSIQDSLRVILQLRCASIKQHILGSKKI